LTPAPNCPNCGHAFGQPRTKFCGHCGQESDLRAPTLGEFVQQFGGAYLSTEGALWRTLRLLLFRPGELTRQYLAGRRRHYVLPLRLYLTISLIALLVLQLMAQVKMTNLDDPKVAAELSQQPRNVQIGLVFGRAGVKDGVFFCNNLPDWLCNRIETRIDVSPKDMMQRLRTMVDRLSGHWGAMMFFLLPAFAVGLKLLYLNRRLRYTEHLVFALHLHAFWFFLLAVVQLLWEPLQGLAIFVMPAYALLALRRVYGGRWVPLLARALALGLGYGLLIALMVVTGALVAILW
jgi:hypothetical protein